jgi:hypothetical protein
MIFLLVGLERSDFTRQFDNPEDAAPEKSIVWRPGNAAGLLHARRLCCLGRGALGLFASEQPIG